MIFLVLRVKSMIRDTGHRALTGLDHIEQGGAERGLLGLEAVEHLLGEVLLQQGLAVGGGLQLLEARLELLQGGGVNHLVRLFVGTAAEEQGVLALQRSGVSHFV